MKNATEDDARLARLLGLVERDPSNSALLADALQLALALRNSVAAQHLYARALLLPAPDARLCAQLCLHCLLDGRAKDALSHGQTARVLGLQEPVANTNTA